MVRRRPVTVILLVLIALLVGGLSGAAAATAKPPLVDDQAGLYTAGEVAALKDTAQALGNAYAMDIVIVTTDDTGGKSARDYADDYFDYNGYGVGEERDGVLYLLDMEHREVYISTSGQAIRILTDARIDSILDDVFAGGLSEGDYYGGTEAFLTATGNYLAAGVPEGQYTVEERGPNTLTFKELIIGGIVAVLVAGAYTEKIVKAYKGKPKPAIFDVNQNSQVNLSVVSDTLVNSRVFSRAIPRVEAGSSSGHGTRSTVHHSSSGRSHGGGGRRF